MTNGWIDIKNTDMMLIMGGNPAENHPCGFKWPIEAKRQRNAKMIVVDPRFTRTAAVADLFVQIRAGSDIAFLACVEWNDLPFRETVFDNTYQTMPETAWNYWNLIQFREHTRPDGTLEWLNSGSEGRLHVDHPRRGFACMGQDPSPLVVSPGRGQMNRWQRRIERAEELARTSSACRELLNFYIGIARFQSAPPYQVEALMELIRRSAPGPMVTPDGAVQEFCERVLLEAQTEDRAQRGTIAAGVQPRCPFCGEKPVAAVLRPESDGGKRFLLCSQCFTEWEFRRLLCPNCSEEDENKLPVYTAEEFPYVRVEACDTCHVYLKAIDLTKNGLAVPEVDELATAVLDLWASEHGYTKLQANLFGL